MIGQQTLKKDLIKRLILASSIPILIAGVLSFFYLTDKITDNIRTKNELLAKAAAGETRGIIREPYIIIKEIITLLSAHAHDYEDISGFLDNSVKRSEFFEIIYLLDRQGKVLNVGLSEQLSKKRDDFIGLDLSGHNFFIKSGPGSYAQWSDIFLSPATGHVSLSVSVSFEDMVLVGNFSIEHLHKLTKRLQAGENITTAIVDNKGVLIFHPDKELVDQHLNLSNIEPVQKALTGQTGTYPYEFQDVKYIGSVSKITETGWLVLVSQGYDYAYESVYKVGNIFLGGLIAAVLFVTLLAIMMSKKIIDPLTHLRKSARSVADGKYDSDIPKQGYSEIEDLAGSFRNMASAIQNRETRLKNSEEKLKQLNVELSTKNKELEQVVYVTSHDLRTPLVNIEGFSKELNRSCDELTAILKSDRVPEDLKDKVDTILDKDIPESLKFISKSAVKMDSLLSGLLRLSRIGRTELRIEQLDMNSLMLDITSTFEFQVKQTGTKIEVTDLPPCSGDEIQLSQVFANLIDNALKYIRSKHKGVIKISGHKESDRSVYCIEDNGIGIATDYTEKIFDIFHQLNPDTSSGEGLGLTIVQRAVERNHGKIWVESEPGKGSRFFVSLPV